MNTWKLHALALLAGALALPLLLSGQEVPGCPAGFAGFLPPRLQAGELARVTPGGDPNRLRAEPGRSGQFLGQANPGTMLVVLAGPVCSDEIVWWQVDANGLVGWTAEGLYPSSYFLEPAEPQGVTRGLTAVAQATTSVQAAQAAQQTQQAANATASAAAQLTATVQSAAMTGTAQARITPSATPTVTPTPTITPTFPPLAPLPAEREVITPQRVAELVTLAVLPVSGAFVDFTPDGSQVLLNLEHVYNLPSLERSDTFGGFPVGAGRVVAYSPDLRYIVYFPGGSQPLHLWDTQAPDGAPRPLTMLPRGSNSISVSSGPQYRIALAVGEGYANPEPPQLYIYDIAQDRMLQVLDNPAAFTADVTFNRDGTRLASTGSSIRLIEPDRPQWRIPVNDSSSGGIAYRPVPANQGEQLAYGAGPGVLLADINRGTTRSYPITGGSTAVVIRFSPDGALMATYGVELHGDFYAPPPRFNLFDVETGALLLDTGEYIRGFRFSLDGTLLVVGAGDGTTRVLGLPG
jgi:hypothetical protein